MSEKMEACPFCGGGARLLWHSSPECWVECRACGSVGPNDGDTSTEQNVAAWNTRTPSTAALETRVKVLEKEITRLRGLLIDPGDPAWEDARAVLSAELRKAEMPNHARAVEQGEGPYIPSWIALNLIAHATRTALGNKETDHGE